MLRLLITDDDIHLRKMALTYTEMDDYQCEEAENGREAIEKICALDLMMLSVTGLMLFDYIL